MLASQVQHTGAIKVGLALWLNRRVRPGCYFQAQLLWILYNGAKQIICKSGRKILGLFWSCASHGRPAIPSVKMARLKQKSQISAMQGD